MFARVEATKIDLVDGLHSLDKLENYLVEARSFLVPATIDFCHLFEQRFFTEDDQNHRKQNPVWSTRWGAG